MPEAMFLLSTAGVWCVHPHWPQYLVDITYGVGPWVMGKWIEDDPINGRQRPINTETAVAMTSAQDKLHEAMEKLHAAVAASDSVPE